MQLKTLSLTAGITAVLCVAIAQAVDRALTHYVPIISPYVGLQRAYNTGVAFGFHLGRFQDFIIIAAILLVIAVAVRTRRTLTEDIGFGLMLGGGIANAIDRLIDNRVTDMIQVGHFPIFNAADICINVGVALLLLQAVLHFWQGRNAKRAAN